MPGLTTREARQRRHRRVRSKVSGTPERPRLSVFRSLSHIHAQIIDDVAGRTLVAASTLDPEVKSQLDGQSGQAGQGGPVKGKTAEAAVVGRVLGARAKAKGITAVVFDRGGYIYHGRVKALADGARASGLEF